MPSSSLPGVHRASVGLETQKKMPPFLQADLRVSIENLSICSICGQEAIAAESYLNPEPMCIQKGDLEAGFAESDHVLEGEMRVGGQVRIK